MLSTSAVESPKFSLATPDEFKAVSEKALNVWVGAMSPLWVPFWAASSFGIGAWAVAQGLSRTGSLAKELPQLRDLPAKWPGFASWIKPMPLLAETVVAAPEAIVKPIEDALKAGAAVTGKAGDVVAAAVTETVAAAEPVVEKAAEAVVETVDAAPLIDPVTETPVVPAVAEAIAEVPPLAAKVVETAVEPVVEAAPKVAKVAARPVAAAEDGAETVKAEVVKAADPAPVVKAAAAAVKPVAKAAEAVVKATAPRPIAKDMAVAKPEPSTEPAPAPKTKTPKV